MVVFMDRRTKMHGLSTKSAVFMDRSKNASAPLSLCFNDQSVICRQDSFREFGSKFCIDRELMGQMGQPGVSGSDFLGDFKSAFQ